MRTTTVKRVLPFLGCLLPLVTTEALAQQPQPPFGTGPQPPFGTGPQPAQPAPAQPAQPAPGQPAPGQPAPGSFGGDPAAQPGQPAPGQFGAGANAGAGTQGQFGADGQFQFQPLPGQPGLGQPGKGEAKDEWKDRQLSLINQNSLGGATGLLRTSFAGSGAAGTFRVGFIFDYFTSTGFLCDPADSTEAGVPVTCNGRNQEDTTSHVGGFFSLSATPLPFLEGFAMLRTYANSTSEGNPQLLQVLGDTTLGVKGYLPEGLLGPLQLGAELQLLLLNGTGDVGVSGGSTSARFKINSTLDLRQLKSKAPFRTNLNLGYKVDNSGAAVEDVEIARAQEFTDGRDRQPITRIERFGLGISKVDYFEIGLGVEVPFSFIQPFIEYSVDVPVNRQGYECFTNRVSRGDVCLGLTDLSDPNGGSIGYDAVPSRFGLGARVSPFQAVDGADGFKGLSGLLAFEIGISATSVFVEEIAPQAPWSMYLGIGYAFDVKPRPVQKIDAPPPPPVTLPAPQSYARGFVHEAGKAEGIPDAIVSFQGGVQPPLATGADGRFLTRHLEPGSYTFDIKATGYKPGTCTANVVAATPASPIPPGFGGLQPPPGPGAWNNPQGGAPGGQPPFGTPFGAAPPAPAGPQFTDVDCVLEALPRSGNLVGTVKDAASGSSVSGAVVTVVDALGKEQKVTADGSGAFRAEGLPPGETTLKVDASGFMRNVSSSEIRANEDSKITISLNKRPKNALVKIQGNELKLSDKILFETDSAKILGQSSALLEEVADVLQKNPNLQQIEIQGHTDNTGGREHNQKLSDARAASVRDWLIKAGVSASRLSAKGYGQDRPIAPNVTEANRSKNRRVQFIIGKK